MVNAMAASPSNSLLQKVLRASADAECCAHDHNEGHVKKGRRTNRGKFTACLTLMEEQFVFRNLDRLLVPVREAIVDASTSLEADREGDPDWFDCHVDEETDVIENLLGVAFLICQCHVTEVVSKVVMLHKLYVKNYPDNVLTTTSGSKRDIIGFGLDSVGSYTAVTVLDAFANYFKHRDEWHGDWDTLPARSLHTAAIVESVGGSQGSSGNMRTGAEALGNPSYASVEVFAQVLRSWRTELADAYHNELAIRGLV